MDNTAVRETRIPGRGVGLVAARDIAAGESVVVERAVLTGVSEEFRASCCACCLRPAAAAHASSSSSSSSSSHPVALTQCRGCAQVLLCGATDGGHAASCAWTPGGHGPVACAAERIAAAPSSDDGGGGGGGGGGGPLVASTTDRERLRFLAACADLRMNVLFANDASAASRLEAVCSLCPIAGEGEGIGTNAGHAGGGVSGGGGGGGVSAGEMSAAARLHPLLERAAAMALGIMNADGTFTLQGGAGGGGGGGGGVGVGVSAEAAAKVGAVAGSAGDSAWLLAKEGCNAFGVMAFPAAAGNNDDEQQERRVRGGAVNHLASRVNHGVGVV